MYIGARYVPIFADPVEWDDEREYEPLTIVVHDGNCYTSKCYVPKGAQLPPYPEGQTKYWVKTSDYNYQFADLKKTVTDLSRLVEQFQKDNERFTELINGWNEKVIQWEKDMAAWRERLDTVESNVADLTASLNAEIARAKAAEQANAAAIAQETADRKQAVSELDAAYKAADAALSNHITTNTTDINAIKAEQVIQNTNISANAKNISDNAAEIAKHAARLTDLESNASDWDSVFPDTTIAQEMKKEQTARANGDTALNGRCDAIAADVEEVRDIANHKVDTTTYTAGQAAQDAKIAEAKTAADKANTTIGDWETDHPNQTISQCATSVENEIAAVDAKADANAANIGDWRTSFPNQTIAQAVTDCMPYDKSGVIIPVAKNIPSVVAESVVLAWLNRPLRLSPADETKNLLIDIGIIDPVTKELHIVGPQTLRINEFAATAETPVSTSFASTASLELASNYCIRLNPNINDTGVVGLRYTTASTANGSPYYLGFDAVQITW